jgi:hypothetical protein
MTPERRAYLKKKWAIWHHKKVMVWAAEIMFEPSLLYYALFNEDPPPTKKYCIDSWTEKR